MSIKDANSTLRRQQEGLTLVEVLVAMTLLAILMVPAIQALNTGFLGAEVHELRITNHFRLVSRLEEVLAEPFGTLESAAAGHKIPSSYSEAAATPERLLVYISTYDLDNADADADPFTGTDDDVLWINVAIEGTTLSLATLRGR